VDPLITKTRLLLAQGDEPSIAQGQALLTQLLHHVEAIHNTRKAIQVLALQVWAYDLQGRVSEALEALERALALARPGGFIRTFADLPPLAKMLQELRKRRKASQEADGKLDEYLPHLLAAMSPLAAHEVSTKKLMRQEGLEPLTERELHILHLLSKNLTNREIAREEERNYVQTGNMTFSKFTLRGTNDKPYQGHPATGKKFSVDGFEVINWDNNGMIHGGDLYYDRLTVLLQLSDITPPPAVTSTPTAFPTPPPPPGLSRTPPPTIIERDKWGHDWWNARDLSPFLPLFEPLFYYVDHPSMKVVSTVPQMNDFASGFWQITSDGKMR
jgi:MalT-like TPR region/SnoaL-like polyketide cyclase